MELFVEPLEHRAMLSTGTLDDSFSTDGIYGIRNYHAEFLGDNPVNMLSTPDGGTIVVSDAVKDVGRKIFVEKLSPNGHADREFGSVELFIQTAIRNNDVALDAKLQSDGKILIAGESSGFTDTAFITRLHPDGRVDESFGVRGNVIRKSPSSWTFFRDLAISENGDIFAAFVNGRGSYLTRLDANGKPVDQFGSEGDVSIPGCGDNIDEVEILSDGSIVVACVYNTSSSVRLFSFLDSGLPNESFGDDGELSVPRSVGHSHYDQRVVTVEAVNDQFLFAGYTQDSISYARFSNQGHLDSSFGQDGWISFTDSSNSYSNSIQGPMIAVEDDGAFWIAASGYPDIIQRYDVNGEIDESTPRIETPNIFEFVGLSWHSELGITVLTSRFGGEWTTVYRYTHEGKPDRSFGNFGEPQLSNWQIYSTAQILDAAFDEQGDFYTILWDENYYLSKLNNSGVTDSDFGEHGRLFLSDGQNDRPVRLFLFDGTITVLSTGEDHIRVEKRDSNGELVESEATADPVLDFAFESRNDYFSLLDSHVDASGRIVLLLHVRKKQNATYRIARITTDGRLEQGSPSAGAVFAEVRPNGTTYGAMCQSDDHVWVHVFSIAFSESARGTLYQFDADGGNLEASVKSIHTTETYSPVFASHSRLSMACTKNHIYLGGAAEPKRPASYTIKRYHTQSVQLDRRFADAGEFYPEFGTTEYGVRDIAVDAEDRLVVAALVHRDSDIGISIGRVDANGSWDKRFGQNGILSIDQENRADIINRIIPDQNGDLIFTGSLHESDYKRPVIGRVIGDRDAPSAWQNPGIALDVNRDKVVTPFDALLVINTLNLKVVHRLPPYIFDANRSPFYDTNGDGFLTPLDALIIINELNSRANETAVDFALARPSDELVEDYGMDQHLMFDIAQRIDDHRPKSSSKSK